MASRKNNDVGDPDLPRNELEALHKFSGLMIEKLVKNKHKGGWQKDTVDALYERVEEELEEVYKEMLDLIRARRNGQPDHADEIAKKLARECADTANFLMMLADVAGGLR